jgi:uncharacterized membrane protein YhaH (DUF805 family)
MFKKPFSFEGRIRRTEYIISFVIYLLIAFIINSSSQSDELNSFSFEKKKPEGITSIIRFCLLWFFFAQSAKRCHDRGNSGWFVFIPFYIFWLLFANSFDGENKYGPNPKLVKYEN